MEYTYEMCPFCTSEVKIPADWPAMCPRCGNKILPCSTCYDDLPGWKPCNWTENKGCWRFPKEKEGNKDALHTLDGKETKK
ncbi:MAG: hypothetical protein HPY90_11800 [Syntrophothermus sp.]|uniref:hypothetical protein n=1 Tax=Syntrophothermus sp. TaxID=2736299 RepID=UPI002580C358|nr:hypothetical protein [Syntrophothermus sp.]NSW83931.1 hypothetical protein [Syntrophothermus sp.]